MELTIAKPPARRNPHKNICPNCAQSAPTQASLCPVCGTNLLVSPHGAIAFWLLGDVDLREAAAIADSVAMAIGLPVIIQPARLDPAPSRRPSWKGRSATTILNQLLQRDTPGTLTNLALVADNIVSSSAYNWLFGYAYLGWKASCVSLHPLKTDNPGKDDLIRRARSVCLHEIGHNLELPDHTYASGIQCCMVGEVPSGNLTNLDAYPSGFCDSCRTIAGQKLQNYSAGFKNIFKPGPGLTFGHRYQLISLAGQGGFGSVWKARDLLMHQDVALKYVLGIDFNGSGEVWLAREAARVRALSHPHIIRVYDLIRDGGVGALVMAWVEGEDLGTKLARLSDRLPDPQTLLPVLLQLADALAYVHQAGLVHTDVKPHNCLINQNGDLVLSDFGLTAGTKAAAGHTRIFHTQARGGTPGFAAPEQISGDPPSPRMDVYGFGATAYYLLTGILPEPSDPQGPPKDGINQHRKAICPWAWTVPGEISRLIADCLSYRPEDRPASMIRVHARLKSLVNGETAPVSRGLMPWLRRLMKWS